MESILSQFFFSPLRISASASNSGRILKSFARASARFALINPSKVSTLQLTPNISITSETASTCCVTAYPGDFTQDIHISHIRGEREIHTRSRGRKV